MIVDFTLQHAAARIRWTAFSALLAVVAGCATQDINVSEAALTDRPDAPVVGWAATESPRLVFSPEDEEVTIKLRFEFNYRAVYEWYKVEWLAPDGSPYQVVSLRTDFGSHRDLKATLAIRGKMASRMPGVWRVRIWHLGRDKEPDRLLVARLFRIEDPTPAMLAAGLTPVDSPAAEADRPLAGAAGEDTATAPAGSGVALASAPPAASGEFTTAPPELPGDPAAVPGSGSPAGAASAFPEGLLVPSWVELPAGAVPRADSATTGEASTTTVAPAIATVPGAATGTTLGRAAAAEWPPVSILPPPVLRSLTASGVASVTVDSAPASPGTPLRPVFKRTFPGCPPLYYLPGPGCVEQAPEE